MRFTPLYYYKRKIERQVKKRKAFAVFGDYCARCGFQDIRALQLDHIHGGGTKERNGNKKIDKALSYYKWIIKNPELAKLKFQVLCANCNWIKREESNELARGKTAQLNAGSNLTLLTS